jgi:hypothetical protein
VQAGDAQVLRKLRGRYSAQRRTCPELGRQVGCAGCSAVVDVVEVVTEGGCSLYRGAGE